MDFSWLLHIAFIAFFVSGAALFTWFVVLGAFLVFFTPKNIKQYAFNERHFSEVELAISSGFHFGSLIYGVGLIASVCFPVLGRKRGLADIRSVCGRGFIYVCVFYTTVMLLLMFTVIISMITWLSIS
ncbi:hypothetical protein [Vibrio jasicida]|uniref:hypothetical protein n=1 Tax=Vibrio jasicida TaxID=766224 RepID=UPI000CE56D04|nr:hypothetical protein [Vibrio jasicida]